MQEKFQKFEDNLPYENNINNISNMILLKEYGIDLEEAKFICERYCKNTDIVLNSNLDSLFKEILKDTNFSDDISSKIDSKIVQSSIYMNIMRVDEEINKLKDDCEFEVLQKFDSEDLKFIREIRNLIEFNYEKIEHKDIYIIVKKYYQI